MSYYDGRCRHGYWPPSCEECRAPRVSRWAPKTADDILADMQAMWDRAAERGKRPVRIVPQDPDQREFPFRPYACWTCGRERWGKDCHIAECPAMVLILPPVEPPRTAA